MGAVSRGGRQSGFNMGAAQNYYADMMQRQPRRGFNFTRDPDTSPGLSYDRRSFRERAREAGLERDKRRQEFEDRQAKELADFQARYPRPELNVPPPEAPQKSPFFVSDVRFGDYGIYSPKDQPGSYSIGIEGEPDNQKFSLYDNLDKAEAYINKLRAQKDKDPTSYTVLDYDKKGKFRGYDPTKTSSATDTLLDDPSAVKDRSDSILIDVPKTPSEGPDYKMPDDADPDKAYMMGGPPGRDAEFQSFLDKAKADKEAFMAKIKAEEEGFGQKIKGERAAAFKEFRDKSRAKAEEFRSLRGRRGTPGGFGGSFGDPNARTFTGDFGGGRLAGGGVRGTRGSRGGGGGGRVRGAR